MFLHNNAKLLIETAGVLYPNFGRIGTGHHAIVGQYNPQMNYLIFHTFNDEQIAALKAAFDSEIARSNATKIIISTEFLSSPLLPCHWQLLKTLCAGYETFMVVYLRRQDEFLISFHNHLVKKAIDVNKSLLETI